MLLPHPTALDLVLAQSFDWGTESVSLRSASGRVLGENIYPDRPQPPFDRVTMDGVAIHYPTYAGGQRYFPVDRTQMAGDAPLPLETTDHCREIMTGSPLPAGATTVIRYEDLEAEGDGFRLPEGVADRKNVHWRGSDWPGDGDPEKPLLMPGHRIDAGVIGVLATFGYATFRVSRMPRVTVISTGNELVDVDEQPLDHQIRRSNVYQLDQLLSSIGAKADLRHLPDEPTVMETTLARLRAENDILILSGGVSKGKKDYVPDTLTGLGIAPLFHGVAQRPGKPLWVGRDENTMVFGLPGNPVSSIVNLLVYVRPFILRNLGVESSTSHYARLAEDYAFRPALTRFLSVSLTSDPESGILSARPVIQQGSGDATSLVATDGFLVLPPERERFGTGEVFPYVVFKGQVEGNFRLPST